MIEKTILNKIRIYTRGTYDINTLTGSNKIIERRILLESLTGKKYSLLGSDINELNRVLFKMCTPDGGCLAAQEHNLTTALKYLDNR